ncbi:MAG: hypothetical protein WD749_09460 [Phycisphaerales bacterium]
MSHPMRTVPSLLVLVSCTTLAAAQEPAKPPQPIAPATPPPTQSPARPAAEARFLDELTREAAAIRPIVETDLARAFLDTAAQLPEIEPRTLHRNAKTREALTEDQFNALPEERRAGFTKRTYDSRFYYTTGYGSPTIYARPIDVLAKHGLASLKNKKVMDFGYGMIGQGRMMALLGADVHGIDVEPLFALLYSRPGDTGEIISDSGERGRLTLHHGQWPGDPAIAEAVGGGYDAIVSKNTLKMGYIHPARETDTSRLVHLGVTDEEFLKASFNALKPGALFLVYNLSPRQTPPDKPYLPHADGKFPFERSLVERTGFEVLEWDRTDDDAARAVFAALDPSKPPESFNESIFSWHTLLRRPSAR